jgi:GT2 family glycosyltransferase
VKPSVIVVTHNSDAQLPALASSLSEALRQTGLHELIVVDSGSTDGSVRSARQLFPDARVLELGWNAGYAAGINTGLMHASGEGPVLILNPDTRPGVGSIGRLVEALEVENTGIAVPRLVNQEGRTARSLRREPSVLRAAGEALLGGLRAGRFGQLGEVVQDEGSYSRPGTYDWATGAVFCISRRCLDDVGPWDESFFLYSEETDFALRARDAGYALRYEPSAVVEHSEGASGTKPELFALLTVNRVRLFARRHSRAATAVFWLAIAIGTGLRAMRGSRVHRAALAALCRSPDQAVRTARGQGVGPARAPRAR